MKENFEKIAARDVSEKINHLVRFSRIPEKYIAGGLFFDAGFFVRLKKRRTGFYHRETILPIERFEKVLNIAVDNLGTEGAQDWLLKPNPYLSGVSPVLCLRTDSEAEKVIDLLESIGLGLPA